MCPSVFLVFVRFNFGTAEMQKAAKGVSSLSRGLVNRQRVIKL